MNTTVTVYDTKPYDRQSLARVEGAETIDWRFLDFRLSPETALAASGAQAVCVFVNDDAGRAVLEKLAGLGVRLVALRCTGFNNVDLSAAKELGLPVTRVPNYSPYAVAEHTVALLLALNRKLHRAFSRVRELNFSLNGLEGFDLHGKTAGIFGTGKIGRIVAEILKGFGIRVLAYDPYPSTDWATRHGVVYTDQQSLARESDVLSLHVPLTPETKHMVRRETIALMKPTAILVNVSRGQLIDTAALIQALKSRRIGGVALDVYEEEEGVFLRPPGSGMPNPARRSWSLSDTAKRSSTPRSRATAAGSSPAARTTRPSSGMPIPARNNSPSKATRPASPRSPFRPTAIGRSRAASTTRPRSGTPTPARSSSRSKATRRRSPRWASPPTAAAP